MLSNGSENAAVKTPEMQVAVKVVVNPLPHFFSRYSFASSYETNMAIFNDTALPTVGPTPFQSEKKPSSLTILPRASKTFL